jgi:hypothetical protein
MNERHHCFVLLLNGLGIELVFRSISYSSIGLHIDLDESIGHVEPKSQVNKKALLSKQRKNINSCIKIGHFLAKNL